MKLSARCQLVVLGTAALVSGAVVWSVAGNRAPEATAEGRTATVAEPSTRHAEAAAVAEPAPRDVRSPEVLPRRPDPSAVPPVTPKAVTARGATLLIVPGSDPGNGSGEVRRYRVEVEQGLDEDPLAFARVVQAALSDRRSWAGAGRIRFERMADGPVHFTVTLATPATTDRLCLPLRTAGKYSCYNGSRSVINSRRWRDGAQSYGKNLPAYRLYVINHEVGHALGNAHQFGCRPDGLAPVMMQQTKGVGSCTPNPWPDPSAR